jgi:hypothetical protein
MYLGTETLHANESHEEVNSGLHLAYASYMLLYMGVELGLSH